MEYVVVKSKEELETIQKNKKDDENKIIIYDDVEEVLKLLSSVVIDQEKYL